MELAPRLGETSPLPSQAKPSMFGLAWLGLEEAKPLVNIDARAVSDTLGASPVVWGIIEGCLYYNYKFTIATLIKT